MNKQELLHKDLEEWLSQKLASWGITELTDVQQKAISAGAASGKSLIVSAPTSSGKTLIAEIAMMAALRRGMKVTYLVSHRALADQTTPLHQEIWAQGRVYSLTFGQESGTKNPVPSARRTSRMSSPIC